LIQLLVGELARGMLSDTFAGIAPTSVPLFILMQLLGGALAVGAVLVLYPRVRVIASDLTRLSESVDREVTP